MKLKKLTALGLAVAMAAAGSLTGCGTGDAEAKEEKNSDAKETENSEEKVKLTIATNAVKVDYATEDNYALNWIEEQMGIDMELICLPESDWETKLNLMLASDEKPDVVICGLDRNKTMTYGHDGVFIPLNDLYEKYGNNLKKLFDEHPIYKQRSYDFDGNMYGLLKVNECSHCQINQKIWYNQAWLDELGLEVPETTEEFEEVLRAVKESDYNGNGEADEIPLTGSNGWNNHLEWILVNSFIPTNQDTYSYAENGTVKLAVDTDEFRQGIAWIHKMYEEGLIDVGLFSQDEEQMRQLIRSDEKKVFAYPGYIDQGIDINNKELNASVYGLSPLEGPNGARYANYKELEDGSGGFNYFITESCKNPEAAFKLGDFLVGSEASHVYNYGEEGKYWKELDEEVDSVVQGYKAKYLMPPYNTLDEEFQKNVAHFSVDAATEETRALIIPMPEDLFIPESYEARLTIETQKMLEYKPEDYVPRSNIILETDEQEEFAEIKTSLKSYIETAIAQFIVGEKDIEKDWDSYVDELHGYNTERYVELMQHAYDNYHK